MGSKFHDKLRFLPDALDSFAGLGHELALAVHLVVTELSLVVLVVGKQQLALPFFRVAHQIPLVVLPLLVQVVEVRVVEESEDGCGLIVIDFAASVKLIDEPVPLVRQPIVGVVQSAVPMHVIVLPLTVIEAALLVEKLALSVAHPIALEPLIPAAILILFNYEISLVIRSHRARALAHLRDSAEGLIAPAVLARRVIVLLVLVFLDLLLGLTGLGLGMHHNVGGLISIVAGGYFVIDIMQRGILYALDDGNIGHVLEYILILDTVKDLRDLIPRQFLLCAFTLRTLRVLKIVLAPVRPFDRKR